MALLIREAMVAELLTLTETIPAVEEIFRMLGNGEAVNRPRQKCPLSSCELRTMPAAAPGYGLGIKVYTLCKKGLRFAVLLYDEKNGDLEAIIEATHLGKLRTAAVAAIATRFLTRDDAACLGLFGTGGQAGSQLEAVLAVRPIERVLVFSSNADHRTAFENQMARKHGIPVEATVLPQAVVSEADIVTTATKAKTPLFDGTLLQPGTHINAIGSALPDVREIDGETVKRSGCIVIDDLGQGRVENGDLIFAAEEGLFDWEGAFELGPIVA